MLRSEGRPRRRRPPVPEINVTPLVDVVLVLLIIFMVVVPQLESGAAVEMPTAANVDEETDMESEPLTVSITAHGELYFDRSPVGHDDLMEILRQAHQAAPRRKLQIKGDRSLPYETVRTVFRDCQEIGFPGVGLQVGERSEEEEKET